MLMISRWHTENDNSTMARGAMDDRVNKSSNNFVWSCTLEHPVGWCHREGQLPTLPRVRCLGTELTEQMFTKK